MKGRRQRPPKMISSVRVGSHLLNPEGILVGHQDTEANDERPIQWCRPEQACAVPAGQRTDDLFAIYAGTAQACSGLRFSGPTSQPVPTA